ncbi:hypothetical protein F5Y10DRAFT_66305 [Nemania abortiva]|nr:hypothetical protein F5Y10DRAFT_66305 [Nemania abortiva]
MAICERAAIIQSWLLAVEQATGDYDHKPRGSKRKKADTPVSTSGVILSPPTSASSRPNINNQDLGHVRIDDNGNIYNDDGAFIISQMPSYRYHQVQPDIQHQRRLEEAEGQGQEQHDVDLTSSHPAVRLPTSLPRPPSSKLSLSSIDSMTPPSANSGRTKRPTGPVSTAQNLVFLEKPVRYLPLHDKATQQLPRDVHGLYRRLLGVTLHVSILPLEVKEQIIASLDSPIFDNFWEVRRTHVLSELRTPVPPAPDSHINPAANYFMETELEGLKAIEREASISFDTGRSTPAWNTFVHIPLLQLALRGYHYRNRAPHSPLTSPVSLFPSTYAAPSLEPCTAAKIATRSLLGFLREALLRPVPTCLLMGWPTSFSGFL